MYPIQIIINNTIIIIYNLLQLPSIQFIHQEPTLSHSPPTPVSLRAQRHFREWENDYLHLGSS